MVQSPIVGILEILPVTTIVLGDHTVDHTTMLTDVLKLHFGWNLARVKCLSCLIIALFKVKREHSEILTLPAIVLDDAQTPDQRCRYIWHNAGLTSGCS